MSRFLRRILCCNSGRKHPASASFSEVDSSEFYFVASEHAGDVDEFEILLASHYAFIDTGHARPGAFV